MNRIPFEPIRIYFSDLRSSAGVRQAIARVLTDWTTGVILTGSWEILTGSYEILTES